MTESHSSTTREQQVTIAVNEGLGETLADQAAAHDSSLSTYATTLLEQHLQNSHVVLEQHLQNSHLERGDD